MRVLLDEPLPTEFRHYLAGHEVRTARYMRWSGKSNGELLRLARDEFDALITADQSIPSQQNITDRDVAVVVLAARSNDIDDLTPLVPEILNRLPLTKRGDVIRIEASRNAEV